MDSDVFNCPQRLLAASRPGLRHLCNRKYCPAITPSAPVTQSSAISPDLFQDLYISLAWNVSVAHYQTMIYGGVFVCVLLFWTPAWNNISYLFASLLKPPPRMHRSMGPKQLTPICSLPWCPQHLETEAKTLSPFTAILAHQCFL